ncbi:MAG: hypothetical protein AAF335_04540 [Bacteroidota bacterium]
MPLKFLKEMHASFPNIITKILTNNGEVERMNHKIKEATVKKFYYEHHGIFEKHLQTFIDAYNYAQPLKTLKGLCPYEKVCLFSRIQILTIRVRRVTKSSSAERMGYLYNKILSKASFLYRSLAQ